MSHKIKIYIISVGLFLLGAMQLSILGPNVLAATCTNPSNPLCNLSPSPTPTPTTPPPSDLPCNPGCNLSPPPPPPPPPASASVQDVDCPSGHANTAHTGCVALGNGCANTTDPKVCLNQNPIIHYLNIVIIFLSGLVGVIVVAVIIVGGVQYSLAGDNSSAIQEARKRITNGLIALVAFLFAAAFLQWIIPGGL